MNVSAFIDTLSLSDVPDYMDPLLQALWFDKQGNWDKAHTIADQIGGRYGDWIHAYLHRKEGDIWNANYWYRRAGKIAPTTSLDEEWEDIVQEIIAKVV